MATCTVTVINGPLTGKSYSFPIPVPVLPGFIGGIIDAELAKVGVTGSGTIGFDGTNMTEDIQFADTIPFLPAGHFDWHKSEAVPEIAVKALEFLIPVGTTIGISATIAF